MNVRQQLHRAGATPGKLALIAVLSLVLVGVIVGQRSESSTATPVEVSSASTETPPNTEKTERVGTEKEAATQVESVAWPESNLDMVLAADPFAPPHWARGDGSAAEGVADSTTGVPVELVELQKQGASIVVIGKGRKLAWIGEQRLYIGDVLQGYQVTDITTEGIVLNRLDQQ